MADVLYSGKLLNTYDQEEKFMHDEPELQEYFALVKIVSEFDQRLLTIKGWGVTLSLVALGLGFQYQSYGMFLVAAASSFAFWGLEGAMKRHQMRYYPRMRQIEINRSSRTSEEERHLSAPLIDWSFTEANDLLRGELSKIDYIPQPIGENKWYTRTWLLPPVWIPHAITFFIAITLFVLAYLQWAEPLAGFALGAVKGAS